MRKQNSTPNEYTSLLPTDNPIFLSLESNTRGIDLYVFLNVFLFILFGLENLTSLLPSIILGTFIWFGLTPTNELTQTSIRLLAVFTSCIFALITTSVDISVLVMTALTLLALTHSFQCKDHTTGASVECRLCGELDPLTQQKYDCQASEDAFHHALEGFSSSVVWLIFSAFHLGKAIEVTGLGKRISLIMIRSFGHRILGLSYAILFSELLLAPFVPSNTARGGGIVLPIVQSIVTSLGSTPERNRKLGGFLMLVGSHANLLSASIYLTGMAPNPIVAEKANTLFPGLGFGFVRWLKGSCVPGLVCAAVLPIFLAWSIGLFESDQEDQIKMVSGDTVGHARQELELMGKVSLKEWQLCFVLLACLSLWVAAFMNSTLVALFGIVVLLHLNSMEWKDIANNKHAWETLFWLGGFVTIASQLSASGASRYLGSKISMMITQFNLPPVPSLAIAYFLTTFMFSSLSAHTVAFAATFLEAGFTLKSNPMILTCLLAYFGALGGCMTNFSTGTSAMYFAPGYVKRSTWFWIGLQLALFYLFIYFTVGMGWWKLLGWH